MGRGGASSNVEGLLVEIGLTGLPNPGSTPGSNRPAFNCLDQIVHQ